MLWFWFHDGTYRCGQAGWPILYYILSLLFINMKIILFNTSITLIEPSKSSSAYRLLLNFCYMGCIEPYVSFLLLRTHSNFTFFGYRSVSSLAFRSLKVWFVYHLFFGLVKNMPRIWWYERFAYSIFSSGVVWLASKVLSCNGWSNAQTLHYCVLG